MARVKDLGFSIEELNYAIATGDVRCQTHPEFPELAIYNYSEDVQFRNKWNAITLACRGLILNSTTGEVIARPWEKFFNLGQRDNTIAWDAPVEVTDKMDGSLGILYRRPDGEYAIATRGSFASEQAIHATKLWHDKYSVYRPFDTEMIPDTTYLFEIIYPNNRIVCNYGDMDDLVLLGAVDNTRGHYYGPGVAAAYLDWMGPKTKVFAFRTFAEAVSAPDRDGAEGYVIRSGRTIVKLKQADYVELHRIVTNLSPKTIWEMMQAGRTIGSICEDIPDEFHGYVKDIGQKLLDQYGGIMYGAKTMYSFIMSTEPDISRRRFAEKAKTYMYPGLLFSLLDGKDIKPAVWKMIKPRGDIKTLVKDEG